MNDVQVVVISGGLDSGTLLKEVVQREGHTDNSNIKAISFNYGQRHKKEIDYARRQCFALGVVHTEVDITSITSLLANSGSSLVSDTDVPEGHYGEENMKATVVPNRNMIMASIAAGYAVANEATALWMGVHAGDHFIYPDCRPKFFNALNHTIVLGNEGFGSIPEITDKIAPIEFVQTPYINMTKAEIAYIALTSGLALETTWSCYKGGEIHCGRCGTCVERIEAIQDALIKVRRESRGWRGVLEDPTEYEDYEFWREAINRETI